MDTIHRRGFLAATADLLMPRASDSAPVPQVSKTQSANSPHFREPPLPEGAFARLGSARFRLTPDNTTLRLSPNGRFLATGDYERTKVWNTETGACVFDSETLQEPFVQLTDIYSVDNDGRLLVTNSIHRGGSLYRIDIPRGRYEALPLHYHMDEAITDAEGIRALRRSSAPGEQYECCDCATGTVLWSRSPYNWRAGSGFSGDGSRVLFSDQSREDPVPYPRPAMMTSGTASRA